MAAYPTLPTELSSRCDIEAGFQSQRATNGALKLRRLYSSDKREFTLVHVLTSTQRGTLQTFYETNRLADNTYTWSVDGVTYDVRFAQAPQYVPLQGGNVQATVRLSEI